MSDQKMKCECGCMMQKLLMEVTIQPDALSYRCPSCEKTAVITVLPEMKDTVTTSAPNLDK